MKKQDKTHHTVKYFASRPIVVGSVAVLILLLQTVAVVFFYDRVYREEEQLAHPSPASFVSNDTANVVTTIGRLIELPSDEEPTIATVQDTEKLKDQPFFANAKNGDKVLLYTKAKKIILYDPVGSRVVNVATLNFQPNLPATQSSSAR